MIMIMGFVVVDSCGEASAMLLLSVLSVVASRERETVSGVAAVNGWNADAKPTRRKTRAETRKDTICCFSILLR